eukprot:1225685-Prymnesium_polylepis.1
MDRSTFRTTMLEGKSAQNCRNLIKIETFFKAMLDENMLTLSAKIDAARFTPAPAPVAPVPAPAPAPAPAATSVPRRSNFNEPARALFQGALAAWRASPD